MLYNSRLINRALRYVYGDGKQAADIVSKHLFHSSRILTLHSMAAGNMTYNVLNHRPVCSTDKELTKASRIAIDFSVVSGGTSMRRFLAITATPMRNII